MLSQGSHEASSSSVDGNSNRSIREEDALRYEGARAALGLVGGFLPKLARRLFLLGTSGVGFSEAIASSIYLPASTVKPSSASSSSGSPSSSSDRGSWNFLFGTDPVCCEGAECNLVQFTANNNHRVKADSVTGCCKCLVPLHVFCGKNTSEGRVCKSCFNKGEVGSSATVDAGNTKVVIKVRPPQGSSSAEVSFEADNVSEVSGKRKRSGASRARDMPDNDNGKEPAAKKRRGRGLRGPGRLACDNCHHTHNSCVRSQEGEACQRCAEKGIPCVLNGVVAGASSLQILVFQTPPPLSGLVPLLQRPLRQQRPQKYWSNFFPRWRHWLKRARTRWLQHPSIYQSMGKVPAARVLMVTPPVSRRITLRRLLLYHFVNL